MLKKLLWYNAAFSSFNALLLLVASQAMANLLFVADFKLFDLSAMQLLQILGIGLLSFAAYVCFVAYSLPRHFAQVKIIIIADWSWVVATLLLFVFAIDIFKNAGLAFFEITALIVTGFALKQTKYLKLS